MDLQLTGKNALITRSTAGTGLAIAKAPAAEGAHAIANGRSASSIDTALARLRNELGNKARLSGFAADLSSADGCTSMLTAHPEVDLLVNNLGNFEPRTFESIGDKDWLRFFDTNVMSGVRLSRHHLPRMKARNWGHIVFISSESGLCPPAEMVHYGMSKTAQLAVARGMAETTTGTGVTVNSVLPGPTRTEGVEAFFAQLAAKQGQSAQAFLDQFFAHARPTSILKRLIELTEIAAVAAVVAFVCSPLAAAINGTAVRAEGGVVRCIG